MLDHCNGDSEALFGVPVDSSSRMYQVKRDLIAEILTMGDKLPEEISDLQVAGAVAECFSGVHPFKTFNRFLEPEPDDFGGESGQAWFRLDWEETDGAES